MSANWTPQFIIEIALGAALGNALAIGVHVFTWWLRKRAWTFMLSIGALALLWYLCGLFFLCLTQNIGYFDLENGYKSPPGWAFQFVFSFLRALLISFVVIGAVGMVQKRRMSTSWIIACLCFCFELALAIAVAWELAWHLNTSEAFAISYSASFAFSLLALASFRPFFLVVLKYIHRYIRPDSWDAE